MTDDEAVPLIESLMTRPPNPSDEVDRALSSARREAGTPRKRQPVWPHRYLVRIEEIANAGPKLSDLIALSPVQWANDSRHSEEIVDVLFPGSPLLCVAKSVKDFETKPRENWRGLLSARQFIVPNPMCKPTGFKKADVERIGRTSARTLDNTGPRRFLVIECDFKERDRNGNDTPDARMLRRLSEKGITVADLCASVIHHLTRWLPLALVVHSGGKSLHGWFYVSGKSEDSLRRFMGYAVSIGADSATFLRSQLVRMPDGTRDGGIRQAVHYFNPSVVGGAA